MDLTKAIFIPQSNVKGDKEISMDDLKSLSKPKQTDIDLLLIDNKFKIKKEFLDYSNCANEFIQDSYGYTAFIIDNELFLIQSSISDVNKELRPKFLTGLNPTNTFKSDYLKLCVESLFKTETKFKLVEQELVDNGADVLYTCYKIVPQTESVHYSAIKSLVETHRGNDYNIELDVEFADNIEELELVAIN